MAVMAREAWTDQRLDDLKENVNQRFDQVDKRFEKVEGEMKARFDEVDKRFDRVEGDIRELRSDVKQVDGKLDAFKSEMNVRFDSMQRTMIIGFVSLIGTVVASVLGGILVTQL